MPSYIVSVSPKGQITIPVGERKNCKHRKYLLETKGQILVLRPIEIKVVGKNQPIDEAENFHALAESTFDFWNNDEDDVFQKFYNQNE